MAGKQEDEKDRLNRKLVEFLNELRVALPGVQVLFAFLLILPFSQGFAEVTDLQRKVFAGTFLSAAMAVVMFIAPAAYHRLRHRHWRRRSSRRRRRCSSPSTGWPSPGWSSWPSP